MIYFDNAATTRVSSAAISAAAEAMRDNFGNPSSLHKLGIESEKTVDSARCALAELLGCDKGEVYFTSGGTEGNNLAIFGACEARRRRGRHVITTQIEHASVLEPMRKLEADGYEVTYLKPDCSGHISQQAVADAVRQDTVLVSVMAVNNEVGAIEPVGDIVRAVKEINPEIIVHSDCVQAFCKIPGHLCDTGADVITVSGHKIHAPKGIGAIYIKKGVRILPRSLGGGQEKGMRSGTEPVPLIAALGCVCRGWSENGEALRRGMADIKAHILKGLEGVSGVEIIPGHDAPHIISISPARYPSEVVMRMLEMRDIYVSSGSACSKGKRSHVLRAMGIKEKVIDSAVRISLSKYTTLEQAECLIAAIKEICR